ncbi:MAG TPA: hypothetical protein VFT59_03910 [Candidatus Saccharimonadales bacterium]|nr:hypothetical protein [Candidatus Saccharimonadales bacterium]
MELFQPIVDVLNAIVGLLYSIVALVEQLISSITGIFTGWGAS